MEGDRDILGVQSYANFHADLHANNIIVNRFTPDEFDLVIIDFGSRFRSFFGHKEDVKVHIYNNFLREEAKINDEGVISKHRILSYGQNQDFCMIALLMLRYSTGIRIGRIMSDVCYDLGRKLFTKNRKHGKEKHFMTYFRGLYNVIGRDVHLVPIYQMLFHNLLIPVDYSGWTQLEKLIESPL
ncbi:hypothetical protein SNEBB_004954 [Seison nebaliae]|nr:hypothetical protein SNEBB_004954 [Seison nebaliae]